MDRHLTKNQLDILNGAKEAYFNQGFEHNRLTPREAQLRVQMDPEGAFRVNASNPLNNYSALLSIDPAIHEAAEKLQTEKALAAKEMYRTRLANLYINEGNGYWFNSYDALNKDYELEKAQKIQLLNQLLENAQDAAANDLLAAQEHARYMNNKRK